MPTFATLDLTQDCGGDAHGTLHEAEGLVLRGQLEVVRTNRCGIRFMSFQPGRFDSDLGGCGDVYLVDRPRKRLLVFDPETGNVTPRHVKQREPLTPYAVAAGAHYLFVSDPAEGNLHAYNLRTHRLERCLEAPVRRHHVLAAAPQDRVYLAELEGEMVWRIDADGTRHALGGKWLAGNLIRDLATDAEGNAYVLADNGVGQKILRFHPDGGFPGRNPLYHDFIQLLPGARIGCFTVTRDGDVFAAGTLNKERLLLHVCPGDDHAERLDPGEGSINALHSLGNELFLFGRHRIERGVRSHLERRELRPIYNQGVWYSPTLDSRGEDTLWHKLVLEAEVPEGCRVEVFYAVTEDAPADPRKVRDWQGPMVNPVDALFLAQPGRYLSLKVTLGGFYDRTPAVRLMRLHFPRNSWMSYLPAVYSQQMPEDRFPERFLSIFQTLYEEMEQAVEDLPSHLDAGVTRPEALPALAAWLGMDTDDRMTPEDLRSLIRRAPKEQRTRGTRRGLEQRLNRITAGPSESACHQDRERMLRHPVIVEKQQLDCLDGEPFRQRIGRYYGQGEHAFCVLLDPAHMDGGRRLHRIRTAIEDACPAHAGVHTEVLPRAVITGRHIYLGINTHIEPRRHMVGVNTVLRRLG
ncbi:MAG: phage tail protein [Acidobacteriota bacterium]|nr:phage tail protein [Acidobacteriota bacterium]